MGDHLLAFRASHAAFVTRRRALVAAGAGPRLASALANVGVGSLEALSGEVWEGPGGLCERLARSPRVGAHLLTAAEEFLRRAKAERPMPEQAAAAPSGHA